LPRPSTASDSRDEAGRTDAAGADPSSYDRIPYTSLALPQTHPDRLAATARIFRLSPPNVAACRVLELGCASGGNLLPMAFNLPHSEFVGVDASGHQVKEGRAAIDALGLRNLRLEQASILDIDDAWGRFDYIICHGVFSWVERNVQDAILEVAARNLTAGGVAYVSYNTYPGWHMREMVRRMMRYHASQFADPREQIEQARALLAFLAAATRESGPYGEFIAAEADRAGRAPDSYVFHEHLERTNLPVYFHDFIARASEFGLQFLSEAAVSEMLTTHFPAHVAETLERISPDLVHLEQYMDFIRNRQFRQTLLCHASQRPVRALSADVLRGLLVSSPMESSTLEVNQAAGVAVAFTSGSKRAEVTNPATKAAFALLREAWPRAVEFDALCDRAFERAAPFLEDTPPDQARQSMLGELFGAVMYGLVSVHTVAPDCASRASETPRAHPLAAFQARGGHLVTNAHHQVIDLDRLSLDVLTLADGQRTRGAIIDALGGTGEAGGTPASEREDPTARADRLEGVLSTLARNALLVE
jgi:methyltransferase-like protein/SAM-dependent methyltransferase